jgi:hypothetical protein
MPAPPEPPAPAPAPVITSTEPTTVKTPGQNVNPFNKQVRVLLA